MQTKLSAWSTYPLEGNHDFGVTINSQDFTETDPMITYNLELWKVWLDEAAQKQFAVNGFYSQKLKLSDGTVMDKVRIIAVNTEACYNANFFLMKLRDDPGDQLKWLEQTLYEMEANGETGILLGHVPPGSNSCLEQWAKRYQALLDRYQNVIRLQMFGHVHKEIHNTIRGVESGKPIGVNFWTGAVTPYSDLPAFPCFRRFIVDAETMVPVKVETWAFDPTQENPVFEFHHEMTEYYNMPDLSPSSFDALADRMLEDETLALKYIHTMNQNSPF